MAVQSFAVRRTTAIPARPLVLGPPPRPISAKSTPGFGAADAIQLSSVATTKGLLNDTGVMDLPNRAPRVENPLLSPAQRQLMNSPAFLNVYRNFDLLSNSQQQACLQKVELLQQKYPQFLDTLNKVSNPRYGEGFQYFIIPPEDHKRWKDIPAGVRGMGGGTNYSGIVYSSPALSLMKNDSKLKLALNYLSQGTVDAVSVVKPGKLALDVGGMFTDSGENTFAHEMGHVLHAYFMPNAEQLEIWSIYTEANQSDKGFITDYSRTNHMEFFAEGVEAFLKQDGQGNFIERDMLKQTNPRLYSFVAKMLEPGNKGQATEPLSDAWTVTRGKAKDSYKAIKNLFSKAPSSHPKDKP